MASPAISDPAAERISWTCPLGLRFFDVATGLFVPDGLRVTATRADVVGPVAKSQLTPSGVHAFHRLQGLATVDPPEQTDPWEPPPKTREFRIEVEDTLRRFLPCTFLVAAPVRGLEFPVLLASPPTARDPRGVPLFSTPNRNAPAGHLVLRAELRELVRGERAAWALLKVHYVSGGKNLTAHGMADDKGKIVVMFPRPEGARREFGGSPPAAGQPAQCAVRLDFFHDASLPEKKFADYGRRLSQPPANAFREGSPGPLIQQETLLFGADNHLGLVDLVAT